MRKKLVLLFGVLLLTGCDFFAPNGYWTDAQNENMANFAETRFSEIKEIIGKYDALVTDEFNTGSYRFTNYHNGCFIQQSGIKFTIQEISYAIILDLAPNEQEEAVIQEVRLNAESPNFTNKSECIFDKNKYIVINDLLDYLDQYIFAKTFVDLSKIENYMHISLENYSEKENGGIYEETISNKENMVDFRGAFYYIKESDTGLYYNSFFLTFNICSNKS